MPNNIHIIAGAAAGILAGIANFALLRATSRMACGQKRRLTLSVILAIGYAVRYAVIVGIVWLLARHFSLPVALCFLLGMLAATFGMTVVYGRHRKP